MKQLQIDGSSFEMPDAARLGFVEGHPCTAVEAKNLYQTWCEGVGNNTRSVVKKMKEEGKSESEITAFVTDYAANYTFATPGVGRTVKDPVERECNSIARKTVIAKLAETGRTLKSVPEGMSEEDWNAKVQSNIDRVAEHPETIKVAKKRVAERQKAGAAALEVVDL